VNVNDPLGPDGLAFTEDDGLRLLPSSKLVHGGVGGANIGAYGSLVEERIFLTAQYQANNQLRLVWPVTAFTWVLQSAPAPTGEWSTVTNAVSQVDGGWAVVVDWTGLALFFRLVR